VGNQIDSVENELIRGEKIYNKAELIVFLFSKKAFCAKITQG
jgi:hypothetical protein